MDCSLLPCVELFSALIEGQLEALHTALEQKLEAADSGDNSPCIESHTLQQSTVSLPHSPQPSFSPPLSAHHTLLQVAVHHIHAALFTTQLPLPLALSTPSFSYCLLSTFRKPHPAARPPPPSSHLLYSAHCGLCISIY